MSVLNRSRTLGPAMLAPALILLSLFFLLPVVMTAVFSMTDMSTATGIGRGTYQLTPVALSRLSNEFKQPDLATRLGQAGYRVDAHGIDRLKANGAPSAFVDAIAAQLMGRSYGPRDDLVSALRVLPGRPDEVFVLKRDADAFLQSAGDGKYDSAGSLLAAVSDAGQFLTPEQQQAVVKASYTGWTLSVDNYARMVSSPGTWKVLGNTLFYVFGTLSLFNIGFALVLALATHYMPARLAGGLRAIWLLPRITPSVLYVLLWKWLAWDTGFISMMMSAFGVPARNWMLDSATNAWIFVFLINGVVGASMGMLIFSSALAAIPKSHFWASDVDGASRWQQIRYIVLPQLRWPLLFVTCYQTLSLLTSFEYILLATDGGPGGSTEVWALSAFHVALHNYAGNLQYGYGSALAMVLVGIGLVLSCLYLKLFGFTKLVVRPRIEI
ncbi:ABC transporter permease subunit [Paraburkholderia sp. IMGN_8]|uniref:ABC transporter permease subunit n=1 Tax=Paraburkholderia sp. IMGN_8 TaxID=3136564 RepID=UPI0031016FE0